MKVLGWVVKIVIGMVVLLLVLLGVGFGLVNSSSFQNKMLQKATTMLAEKLQTRVEIDSVSVDLLTLDAKLYGLDVEDRQQRKMLALDFLQADVDVWPLVKNREVRISEVIIKGVKAQLFHTPNDSVDSVANYQFVIDAFKKEKKPGEVKKTDAEKQKKKFTVALKKVTAEDLHVTYNGFEASLGRLLLTQPDSATITGTIEQLATQWERTNKKGWQVSRNQIAIGKPPAKEFRKA